MLVEAKKKLFHGFVLNEQDLRRTIDMVSEQFQKLDGAPNPDISFELKYRNGAIGKTGSIDDIFREENLGSSQIIRLIISFNAQVQEEQVSLVLGWVNSDLDEEPGITSIWYNISGNSRDWVFVTSSLLQERIEKVKRFCPNQIAGSSKRGSPLRLLIILLFTLFLTIPIALIIESTQGNVSDVIIQAKENGELSNAIDALILIEQTKESRKTLLVPTLDNPFVYFGGGLLVLTAVFMFFLRYYLVYNFVWGDYANHFNKSENVRKFVLAIIVVGVVVSFIGGILANMTSIGK